MFDSPFIDIGIGLIFIYLLMSILVSTAQELFTKFIPKFNNRSRTLKNALELALNDPNNVNFADRIYCHPMIQSMMVNSRKFIMDETGVMRPKKLRYPSYITPGNFSRALIDAVCEMKLSETDVSSGSSVPGNDEQYSVFVQKTEMMKNSQVKQLFLSFCKEASGNKDMLRKSIEDWYNQYMERVGGWYKNRVQVSLLCVSFAAAVFMNVDTLEITNTLWADSVLSQSVAGMASGFISDNNSAYAAKPTDEEGDSASTNMDVTKKLEDIKKVYATMNMLNLPIGWKLDMDRDKIIRKELKEKLNSDLKDLKKNKISGSSDNLYNRLGLRLDMRINYFKSSFYSFLETNAQLKFSNLLGWFITAIAASFGAPFWFDLLSKVVNVRNAGRPSAKETEEAK